MNTPVAPRDCASTSAEPLTLTSTKLVLWDLDGPLFHTLPVMRAAWQRVRELYGISASFDDYAEHLGRPFVDILRILGLDLPQDQPARIQSTYLTASQENAELATPPPGVEEVLQWLDSHGFGLGVVTSKSWRTAGPLLDRFAVPWAVVRTPGRERGKPAPDSLLLAVTDVGVDPCEALYIGDMAVDQQAANRAGIPYVHADWGYGSPEPPCAVVLSDPTELPALLPIRGAKTARQGSHEQ
ncbi:HAD family hydrolase [Actinophytocola sp.]|uniref:HAD family hydrolase n=1 Tax=Actinophytocola sp. TaxID=1872138 RepID=UPI00389B1F19